MFCPFHGNKYTPSMTVSKTNGKFICHNGACHEMGTMEELILATRRLNPFQIRRLIQKASTATELTFEEKFAKASAPAPEMIEWEQAARLPLMQEQFWNSPQAIDYMHSRGFTDKTLKRFGIGYSRNKNLLAVPMYSEKGLLVGVVGRPASHTDKRFRNSDGLPTSRSLYNIHNAKRSGAESVIVVEASFDVMSVDQSGYPNVVGCLGGHFSDLKADQLDKYFTEIIIMTDMDDAEAHRYVNCRICNTKEMYQCKGHNPGRQLGQTIADKMQQRNKTVRWASYNPRMVYPMGAKDANDMLKSDPSAIAQCINNRVSGLEYSSWNLK